MNKVTCDALCIRDKRTIPDSDLIDGTTDMPVNGRQRRTGLFSVNHNSAHRYYYKKEMGPEDVPWIKLYDSKSDGRDIEWPSEKLDNSLHPQSAASQLSLRPPREAVPASIESRLAFERNFV